MTKGNTENVGREGGRGCRRRGREGGREGGREDLMSCFSSLNVREMASGAETYGRPEPGETPKKLGGREGGREDRGGIHSQVMVRKKGETKKQTSLTFS
jgi:hypothetical protein